VEVTVLLFASAAEKAGTRKFALAHEPGDTVGRVRDRIVERFPALRENIPTMLYALNEEYVKEWDAVPAGATLALIPPVSGG
jgi:molybdopterin converting factor subunit 1